jgi:hypothetical protein
MSPLVLEPDVLAMTSNLLRENSEVYEKGFWENPSEPHHDLLMDLSTGETGQLHPITLV